MSNKIRNYVLEWNRKFPVDLWWRRKHNVAFMSEVHKSTNFLDQLFEYEEERIQNELIQEELRKQGLLKEDNKSKEEQIQEMSNEFDNYLKERGVEG